jgi:hypothetical protein
MRQDASQQSEKSHLATSSHVIHHSTSLCPDARQQVSAEAGRIELPYLQECLQSCRFPSITVAGTAWGTGMIIQNIHIPQYARPMRRAHLAVAELGKIYEGTKRLRTLHDAACRFSLARGATRPGIQDHCGKLSP